MAELLILTFDTFNPDPELDHHAYKMGHIIDIKPDGYDWAQHSGIGLPKHWIIKVTGATVDEAQEWSAPLLDFTDMNDVKTLGIRKFKFDINSLPSNIKTALLENGYITVQKSQVMNYLKVVSI